MSKEVAKKENGQELQATTFKAIQDPEVFAKVSKDIQQHVKKNKLTSNIKGKNYPHVEAWQFAGALFGIFPNVAELTDLSTDAEKKYRSRVVLVDVHTGRELGSGVGVCSNKENSKRNFDEYAIASMAQTRATGKAFRIMFGWLMKAAGFEGTPAEEMQEDRPEDESTRNPKWYQVLEQFKKFAVKSVGFCEKAEHIHKLSEIATLLHEDKDFVDTARAQYKALKDEIQ